MTVIAADGGAERAIAAGMTPDVVVGDRDSVDPAVLAALGASGTEVVAHRPDKDRTDFELAFDYAVTTGATRITVVGTRHGRLDHFLSMLAVMVSGSSGAVEVEALIDSATVVVVRGFHRRSMPPGTVFSLLAYGGPARLSLAGARWPLRGAVLDPAVSLAISNEVARGHPPDAPDEHEGEAEVEVQMEVQVKSGTVILVVDPDDPTRREVVA
ncbi:MAG: thiamine diphosphokinase [Microthrixaceae bacterium]